VTNSAAGRPELGAVLTELSSARVPWLALARDLRPRSDATVVDATVIDPADPHVPPVTVNPLEPEPGYPVQAHSDRLAGLLAAAFGPPDAVAAALRAGLQRAYADCGWDALTGGAPPGARTARRDASPTTRRAWPSWSCACSRWPRVWPPHRPDSSVSTPAPETGYPRR